MGGAPRSGTTLVQNILDSHPAIYGGPESAILPKVAELRQSLHKSLNSRMLTEFLTTDQIDAALRAFVLDLLSPLASRKEATWISEKTPENALYFTDLMQLFPAACGIHVVRHPAAIVNSLLKVRSRYIHEGIAIPERLVDVNRMASDTYKFMLSGLLAKESMPDRITVLAYEQLVLAPEKTVQSLCAKLGIDFRKEMLRPENFRHDAETIVAAGTPWYTMDEFKRAISDERALAWESELDPQSIKVLKSVFSTPYNILNRLGYSL